ncbi:hypothetical protein GL50803_0018559 [Giardia duodenalis]|uniref:Uncharacterized protein n=1 Tax=Giardia intestinalis (strain ATCC 50803 / WB clone C6) TaxID=184922 RepID=A8BN16_GIAIC|nr:hypothetical protein GL50803_0018559 [Giardia intestinalis]KAE8305566.1 hypothetical protein GL50803_0018559 [Giardia intestinalis]|eukprot:XP_001706006.1 Hypothetical protein GL50803_18559 [Giardia lamblia ATCC 50803]
MRGVLSALPSTFHSHFVPPSVAPLPSAGPKSASEPSLPLVGDHLHTLEPYAQQLTAQQQKRPRFRLLVAKLPRGTSPLQLTTPLEQAFPCSVDNITLPSSKHGKRPRNFAIIDLHYRIDLSKAQEVYRQANLTIKMKAVDVKESV